MLRAQVELLTVIITLSVTLLLYRTFLILTASVQNKSLLQLQNQLPSLTSCTHVRGNKMTTVSQKYVNIIARGWQKRPGYIVYNSSPYKVVEINCWSYRIQCCVEKFTA